MTPEIGCTSLLLAQDGGCSGSRCDQAESHCDLISLFEHDLRANAFRVCREGKPVSPFPDHALTVRVVVVFLMLRRSGCNRRRRCVSRTGRKRTVSLLLTLIHNDRWTSVLVIVVVKEDGVCPTRIGCGPRASNAEHVFARSERVGRSNFRDFYRLDQFLRRGGGARTGECFFRRRRRQWDVRQRGEVWFEAASRQRGSGQDKQKRPGYHL